MTVSKDFYYLQHKGINKDLRIQGEKWLMARKAWSEGMQEPQVVEISLRSRLLLFPTLQTPLFCPASFPQEYPFCSCPAACISSLSNPEDTVISLRACRSTAVHFSASLPHWISTFPRPFFFARYAVSSVVHFLSSLIPDLADTFAVSRYIP